MMERKWETDRASMIATIEAEYAEAAPWLGKAKADQRVLDAMLAVPRDAFVPPELRRYAHLNRPLPIGFEQTISQPFIVAIMTDLARVDKGHRVLEVGTGCGYQSAVLAQLGARVYSIETIDALAAIAAERLARLGYYEVSIRCGDGAEGWPEQAPFDAIIVTAAAAGVIPPPLIEQLAPGGRLLIPVDRSRSRQGRLFGPAHDLMRVTKTETGVVETHSILPVAFVPLVSDQCAP